MALSPFRSFGSRTAGLATAGVASAFALALPATAQQALNKDQCFKAMSMVGSIMNEYKGKLSREFNDGLKQFVARDCDMSVEFKVMPGTADKPAFEKFRVYVTAIRTAQTGPNVQPVALSK